MFIYIKKLGFFYLIFNLSFLNLFFLLGVIICCLYVLKLSSFFFICVKRGGYVLYFINISVYSILKENFFSGVRRGDVWLGDLELEMLKVRSMGL